MLFEIAALLLLGLAVLVVLIDVAPIFRDWLSRIHIGRYEDKEHWNSSITKAGMKWLNRTPKIKVTDNTRFVVLDMLRGNYTKSAIQHWQEASLLLGLYEYLRHSRDRKTEDEIRTFLNAKFDAAGGWKQKPGQIDAAILGYAVMKLDFVDVNRYRKAFDEIWELIRDHIGEDGTVQYRKSMKHYRYVDTIGFICPFLVAYGTRYGIKECVTLAVKQLQEYERHGMHGKYYIPSHAYHLDSAMPLGLYGWGRGLGWFAIGLADAWLELPAGHGSKAVLEEMIKKFAGSVLDFQRPDGNWNWSVARGESRPDSSTTATLGWFLLQASKIGEIRESCERGASLAVRYLMKVTRRSGAVDFSQGDTKDIGVYSMLFNILPFTQGFCIRVVNHHNHSKVV
ncbi:glycoside hydrolase family 88 protein [Paenibacillus arenilitoris]|uniref:Glycoside hydrolase family 88 protein n=1 Tax=Paenibacillus arenilitoris TaxID=2772299 RepID=A0A927CQS1_9BACL|nr:glycoside hydrolase family 88 protein [Paenibacillus arenilitoris]MBD2872034.1 glycoside hydrolase family 88 protein [Paenibacillus arenilitoris]